jgi:hypothetical protein
LPRRLVVTQIIYEKIEIVRRHFIRPACWPVISPPKRTPYKVLDTTRLMGSGGTDYVYADNDGRRVYVPRGNAALVFDLDSHQYIGAITNISGHGVAVDTKSHHGFSSSPQIGMFDTETMQKIKSIEVARPAGWNSFGTVHRQDLYFQP